MKDEGPAVMMAGEQCDTISAVRPAGTSTGSAAQLHIGCSSTSCPPSVVFGLPSVPTSLRRSRVTVDIGAAGTPTSRARTGTGTTAGHNRNHSNSGGRRAGGKDGGRVSWGRGDGGRRFCQLLLLVRRAGPPETDAGR